MFDWDEANLDHIADHGISAAEAEDALLDSRRIPAPAYQGTNERRRGVLGATIAGRLLFVVFTYRNELVRIITARNANAQEKRRYERRGK
jgi:uncharacterized DUF497 family protein